MVTERRTMKRNVDELDISSFRNKFFNQKYVTKTVLKNFYTKVYKDLTDQAFRRILYGLEQERLIFSSGSGVFTIQDPQLSHCKPKIRFEPILSPKLITVKEDILKAFPFIDSVIWETRIIHDFMIHQPNVNMIILEVEKGIEESVFNHLNGSSLGPVFLAPDHTFVDRYVFQQPESIIVSKLVSRAPRGQKGKLVQYAKMEKILIDLLVDQDRFYIYQGHELSVIYENVFEKFLINEDSLLNYAKRRNAIEKLRTFIQNQTKIELREFLEGLTNL